MITEFKKEMVAQGHKEQEVDAWFSFIKGADGVLEGAGEGEEDTEHLRVLESQFKESKGYVAEHILCL